MRRILIVAVCVMLLPIMALTGFADNDTLIVSDAKGRPGDMVYLTVTINETVSGDTLGVQYTYDPEILKAVPASSSWSKRGALQDFGIKDVGVWAVSSPVNLQGPICILAFSVKEEVDFDQTEVTCEVTVRDGDQLVGSYTAVASVSYPCDHSFGQWENLDDSDHIRSCSSCEMKETESHQWDEGRSTEKTDEPIISLQTFTCEICGATKEKEIITLIKPTYPPAETNPPKENTKPTELPLETQQMANIPTTPVPTEAAESNRQLESFIENVMKMEETESDYSEETEQTEPAETEDALDRDHDHTHDAEEKTTSHGVVLAAFGVIAAFICVSLWIVNKKYWHN